MRYFIILVLSLILFSGCATTTYTKDIKKGVIDDNNIIITLKDGGFKLQGEFTPPFKSSVHLHSLNIGGEKFIQGYQNALSYNAKHVTVKLPNEEKEFYGVLALDDIDERGYGVGAESYKIIIPKPYIDAAKDGKISIVYEYYHIKDDGLFDNSHIKKYSWILWLSDKDIFK